MTNEAMFVDLGLRNWKMGTDRADKLFGGIGDDYLNGSSQGQSINDGYTDTLAHFTTTQELLKDAAPQLRAKADLHSSRSKVRRQYHPVSPNITQYHPVSPKHIRPPFPSPGKRKRAQA